MGLGDTIRLAKVSNNSSHDHKEVSLANSFIPCHVDVFCVSRQEDRSRCQATKNNSHHSRCQEGHSQLELRVDLAGWPSAIIIDSTSMYYSCCPPVNKHIHPIEKADNTQDKQVMETKGVKWQRILGSYSGVGFREHSQRKEPGRVKTRLP